jgi:hypothetical protein
VAELGLGGLWRRRRRRREPDTRTAHRRHAYSQSRTDAEPDACAYPLAGPNTDAYANTTAD